MADVALVLVAVDGIWLPLGRVPEASREAVLMAATAGLAVAIATRSDEPAARLVCRWLHLDAATVVGPELHAGIRGREVAAGGDARTVLSALAQNLADPMNPFTLHHTMAVAATPAEADWLAAAGIAIWLPTAEHPLPPAGVRADLVLHEEDGPWPGVAEAFERVVLRNNRFLRSRPPGQTRYPI